MEQRDFVYLGLLLVVVVLYAQSRLKTYLAARTLRHTEAVETQRFLANEIQLLRVTLGESKVIGKYLEGLERVAVAQVAEISKLREVVDKLATLIAAKPQEDDGAYQPYDPVKAEEAFRLLQFVEEGHSPVPSDYNPVT